MGGLTLYFDKCIGKRLPKALRHIRCPAEIAWHVEQRFRDDMPDDEWLEVAGKNEWTVISHDRKFHQEAPALAAIKQHKVGCFYLSGASNPMWEKLKHFVRIYDRMIDLAKSTPKPFVFHLTPKGQIRRVKL